MIYNDSPREKTDYDSNVRRDDQERLRALERELKRAQQMYDVVVGFQGRIKWRREIEAVQTEIRKILDSQPAGMPESAEISADAVAEAAATQA
jgi:hypothetical protein